MVPKHRWTLASSPFRSGSALRGPRGVEPDRGPLS